MKSHVYKERCRLGNAVSLLHLSSKSYRVWWLILSKVIADSLRSRTILALKSKTNHWWWNLLSLVNILLILPTHYSLECIKYQNDGELLLCYRTHALPGKAYQCWVIDWQLGLKGSVWRAWRRRHWRTGRTKGRPKGQGCEPLPVLLVHLDQAVQLVFDVIHLKPGKYIHIV